MATSLPEALLRESEGCLRVVVEESPQGILIHQDRRIVFANPSLAEMFGYDNPADLLGLDAFETLASPEDRPILLERTEAFYRGERRPPHPGFHGVRRDGSSIWVMTNASLTSWQGQPAIIAFYTNVTEIRRTVQDLRDSEARFRTLVEHAPEAIVVLDVDRGTFAEVNDNACRFFGMAREELLKHGPLELSPPIQPGGAASADLGYALIDQAISGKVVHFEWVHRDAKGGEVPCEVRLVRLPSEKRRLVRGSILDIAQRKRIERREQGQRAILERMAQGQPLPVILEAIVELVEQESPGAICSILLLDEAGQHLLHGAAPHLPEFYNQAVHGLQIGLGVGSCGTAAFTGERVIVEDTETHPYWQPFLEYARRAGFRSCWSEPILSSAGRVLGTFAIYHEQPCLPTDTDLFSVSIATHLASIAIERHRAAESLRVNEERLRLAADAARFGSYDRDLAANTRVWSPNLREIFGVGPEEPIDDEVIRQRVHPDDWEQAQAVLRASFDPIGTGKFALQHRVVRPDGSIRWVDIMGRTLFEGEGGARRAVRAVGVVIDITERKRDEEERRRFETQLLQAQKLESLGLMAGGIAHDFNNLLTGILGFSDLAQQALPAGSIERGYLEEVVKGARQAAELTQRMLAYSGRGRFVVQPLDLSTLIEDMAGLLEISISKKCVLRRELARGLPSCEADSAQMRQVVMNLIINASEAIGDGHGVIEVRTGRMHCDRGYLSESYVEANLAEGEYVYVEVADTGPGMSAETRAKIFDPFFTTKFTGRGLGLAAVLGIVRGHHGVIKVRSEPGQGAIFRVALPASTLVPFSETVPSRGVSPWRGSGVVLVVDDEESVRILARAMLEIMGFTVFVADEGRQGVELFRQHADTVRLVLLDMTMPMLDGKETLRELQSIRPDIRAILSSGYDEQSVAASFPSESLAGFIQKPYRYESLRDVVRKSLGE